MLPCGTARRRWLRMVALPPVTGADHDDFPARHRVLKFNRATAVLLGFGVTQVFGLSRAPMGRVGPVSLC